MKRVTRFGRPGGSVKADENLDSGGELRGAAYTISRKRPDSCEDVVKDIQRVATTMASKTTTQAEYERHGLYSVYAVEKLCGSWNAALEMAGCSISHRVWTPGDCLAAIKRVWDHLGRRPKYDEYASLGPSLEGPGISTLEVHFGGYKSAIEKFVESSLAHGSTVVNADSQGELDRTSPLKIIKPHKTGEPTGFSLMPYAPTCETALILLFGMLAKDLDFIVECVRSPFPDCLARKRDSRSGYYIPVTIEFELKSVNFKSHKHPHDTGALLVCWEDNWKDRPSSIQVLCIKNYLASKKH